MPTVVAPADRKLAHRRRVRTTKQETQAINAFLDRIELAVMEGKLEWAPRLKLEQWVTDMGFKFLGDGVYKSAFSVPGGRWVIKMPNRLGGLAHDRKRFLAKASEEVTVESRMFTRASPELREYLARARNVRGWATLQERVKDTITDAKCEAEARDDYATAGAVIRKLTELREKVGTLGVADNDLHGGNVGLRADGSAVIIDYALERF